MGLSGVGPQWAAGVVSPSQQDWLERVVLGEGAGHVRATEQPMCTGPETHLTPAAKPTRGSVRARAGVFALPHVPASGFFRTR